MSELVRIERHDGWAILTIAREEKRNAMDRATRTALRQALRDLEGQARAVVLTGSGKSFCAGIDLKEREADRAAGDDSAPAEWIDVNLAIRHHPAIFIAAVNGLALGGGATLITVCDLAVASTAASIGCPEMGFATYPGTAGPGLQKSLSRKRAAWMVLTTNRIDGQTACDWGLVNEVVEPSRLVERSCEIARQIAGFDAVALAESKAALDAIPGRFDEWENALAHGQTTNRAIRAKSEAGARGASDFAAGRRAPGQGVSN